MSSAAPTGYAASLAWEALESSILCFIKGATNRGRSKHSETNFWLMPARENLLWGESTPAERYQPEHPLFPGLSVLLLAAAALLLPRSATWPPPQSERRVSPHLLHAVDLAIVLAATTAIVAAVGGGIDWRAGSLRILSAVPLTLTVVLVIVRLWLAYPWRSDGTSLRTSVVASPLPAGVWCGLLWVGIGVIGSLVAAGLNPWRARSTFFCLNVPVTSILGWMRRNKGRA